MTQGHDAPTAQNRTSLVSRKLVSLRPKSMLFRVAAAFDIDSRRSCSFN